MSKTSWRPRGVLEIDADAAFAEIVAEEGGAEAAALGIGRRGLRGSAQLAARRFDLHHVGPEPRQELGGKRQRLHLLEGQDADADQRPSRPPVRRLSDHIDHLDIISK